MSNVFSAILTPPSKELFGGKRHKLTDADRRKAGETRKRQLAERKRAKAKEQAAALGERVEPKRTGSKVAYFASPVDEAFTFMSSLPAGPWQLYGDSMTCDPKRFVASLSLALPGLRMIKHAKADFVYVLVYRETGARVCVLVKGTDLGLAVQGTVDDGLDCALDMIRDRAHARARKQA